MNCSCSTQKQFHTMELIKIKDSFQNEYFLYNQNSLTNYAMRIIFRKSLWFKKYLVM